MGARDALPRVWRHQALPAAALLCGKARTTAHGISKRGAQTRLLARVVRPSKMLGRVAAGKEVPKRVVTQEWGLRTITSSRGTAEKTVLKVHS
jgi:hypothetical protein